MYSPNAARNQEEQRRRLMNANQPFTSNCGPAQGTAFGGTRGMQSMIPQHPFFSGYMPNGQRWAGRYADARTNSWCGTGQGQFGSTLPTMQDAQGNCYYNMPGGASQCPPDGSYVNMGQYGGGCGTQYGNIYPQQNAQGECFYNAPGSAPCPPSGRYR